MIRALLLSALVSVSAVSEDHPLDVSPSTGFVTGEALQAVIATRCAEGCAVFTPKDLADLNEALDSTIRHQRAVATKEAATDCRIGWKQNEAEAYR